MRPVSAMKEAKIGLAGTLSRAAGRGAPVARAARLERALI
jgi:hypothetical protein